MVWNRSRSGLMELKAAEIKSASPVPEHYRQVTIEKDLEKGFDYRRITIEEMTTV